VASQNEAPQVSYLFGVAAGRLNMISPTKNPHSTRMRVLGRCGRKPMKLAPLSSTVQGRREAAAGAPSPGALAERPPMLQLEPQGSLIAFRVFISFPAAHTFLKFSAVFPVARPVRILFPRDIKIHVYEAISGIFHALPDSFICVEEKGAAITFAGPMPPGQVGQLVGHLAAGLKQLFEFGGRSIDEVKLFAR
jgi:hypothetical protein